MSIRCERYIGYSLDIMKDIDTLSEEQKEQWLYESTRVNDNIIVLYDGLSGEYCKLFYIIAVDRESFYNDNEVDANINELLKIVSVNMEVKHEMRQAYKTIFGKELEHASLIRAEYVLHYC